MLTTNFYVGRYLQCCNYVGGASLLNIKNDNGVIATPYIYGDISTTLIPGGVSDSPARNVLMFGTNDAEETKQDYRITSIGNVLTSTVGAYTISVNNKQLTVSRRFIINNKTSDAHTIKEFGVFQPIGGDVCLIYRGVIEDFTIEANETVNFDLTVTYDLPSDFEPYMN